MVTVFLILALIVAIIAVIFALQNTAAVTVSFIVWQFDQSLALVLLLSVAIGVIIGLLTILPTVIRNKWQLTGKKKTIESLEKNLNETKLKLEDAERRISSMESQPVPPIVETPQPENNPPIT